MKRTSARRLAGVLLAVTLLATSATAYVYEGVHWFEGSEALSVNTAIPAAAYNSLKGAASAWNNAGSSFRFTPGSKTSATTSYDDPDDVHVICAKASGLTGTLAVNYWWYIPSSGKLLDSDIEFNASYPWSLSGEGGKYDVQSIATHELGHSLNLGDLYGAGDTEKTMYGYSGTGETKKRTLEADDIAGIRAIYP